MQAPQLKHSDCDGTGALSAAAMLPEEERERRGEDEVPNVVSTGMVHGGQEVKLEAFWKCIPQAQLGDVDTGMATAWEVRFAQSNCNCHHLASKHARQFCCTLPLVCTEHPRLATDDQAAHRWRSSFARRGWQCSTGASRSRATRHPPPSIYKTCTMPPLLGVPT